MVDAIRALTRVLYFKLRAALAAGPTYLPADIDHARRSAGTFDLRESLRFAQTLRSQLQPNAYSFRWLV
jgi:hypothetical protein